MLLRSDVQAYRISLFFFLWFRVPYPRKTDKMCVLTTSTNPLNTRPWYARQKIDKKIFQGGLTLRRSGADHYEIRTVSKSDLFQSLFFLNILPNLETRLHFHILFECRVGMSFLLKNF